MSRVLPVPEPGECDRLRGELIARVAATHAVYPQYQGHWDDWSLGIMVKRHWAHGATLADVGDLVLVKPGPPTLRADNPEHAYATIHAERYGVDCSVRVEKVRVLP